MSFAGRLFKITERQQKMILSQIFRFFITTMSLLVVAITRTFLSLLTYLLTQSLVMTTSSIWETYDCCDAIDCTVCETDNEIRIESLSPSTKYRLKVSAKNEVGVSQAFELEVETEKARK